MKEKKRRTKRACPVYAETRWRAVSSFSRSLLLLPFTNLRALQRAFWSSGCIYTSLCKLGSQHCSGLRASGPPPRRFFASFFSASALLRVCTSLRGCRQGLLSLALSLGSRTDTARPVFLLKERKESQRKSFSRSLSLRLSDCVRRD